MEKINKSSLRWPSSESCLDPESTERFEWHHHRCVRNFHRTVKLQMGHLLAPSVSNQRSGLRVLIWGSS